MRSILLSGVLVVAMVSAARAESGILFLNDIFCPCRHCERDPYEERIETERHDFTQSSITVGRGVVQLEAGYSYFYKDEHEIEDSHTLPEMMLRLGLSEDIEFRLKWTYAWRFREHEPDFIGSQDLLWSFKLGITDQHGCVPQSALEIRCSAPTGGSAWSLQRVEAGVDYIYSWELNERWQLFGSTGILPSGLGDFSLLPEEPASDRFMAYTQSAGLKTDLSERNVIYFEYFAMISDGLEEEFRIHFFNIGVDHYFTDNFLVDFRVGKGLSPDADDFFTGVGGGYRF